jgi:hypothetical protein
MSKLGKPLVTIAIAAVLLALAGVVIAPMFAPNTQDAVVVSGPDAIN